MCRVYRALGSGFWRDSGWGFVKVAYIRYKGYRICVYVYSQP